MSDVVCGVTPDPAKGLRSTTTIHAPVERVWRALTDAGELAQWWAQARVDLPAGVYELWGPTTPHRAAAPATRLISHEEPRLLHFAWRMFDAATEVRIALEPQGDATLVDVIHTGIAHSDLWVTALENLRLHCMGQAPQPYEFTPNLTGDIDVAMEYARPAAAVMDALLDPVTLDRFWGSETTIEPQVGGRYDYGWGGGPLKVLAIDRPNLLSISWDEGDGSASGVETVVTWRLAESGGRTRVTLTHTGFAPTTETDGLDIGWYGFLLSLKALLELGDAWSKVDIKGYKVEQPAPV
jgi:uncharacterized protein YndB with AHSA1/START domain